MIGTNGLMIYGFLTQVILKKQFGDNPASDTTLILVTVGVILLTNLIFALRLETEIKSDGIYVRFFPIHFKYRFYPWTHIDKAYVRKYNPILEYGGWGLRGIGKNRALNISGNQGLQLVLEENKRLLIGTRKPEEVSDVLHQLKQYKP